MRQFLKVTLLITIFSYNANAASVSSITQISGQALHFGSLAASSSSTGTLAINGTTSCTPTGGVKALNVSPTCRTGNFLVSGQNDSSGTKKSTIIVFLSNAAANMTGPSTTPVTYSLSSSSVLTSQQYINPDTGANKPLSITVPVYATLTAISAGQTAGTYTGSFTLYGCACVNNSCPSAPPC
jgi:hypothetical protein